MEDPRSTTRVAAAAHAVGPNRPATAVKSVANQWTPAQGAVTPARRSSASVSVPTASSTTANAAVTAEITPARVDNTAGSARRRKSTVSAVQRAGSLSVTAAGPAVNRTVESAAQGAYRGRLPVTVAKSVKRPKLTVTVLQRSRYRQRLPNLQYSPLYPV